MSDTNEKNNNKMQSRKFIVWLVATIICVAILVLSFLKDLGSEVIKADIEFYTWISAIYLGANVGSKFANVIKSNNEENAE